MNASLPQPSGPKTPKGKRTSSRNSTKHGLTAEHAITAEEDRRLVYLTRQFKKEYQPQTITEEILVERVALAQLRLERHRDLERAWYDSARREAGVLWAIVDAMDRTPDEKAAFARVAAGSGQDPFVDRMALAPFELHQSAFLEIEESDRLGTTSEDLAEFGLDHPEILKRIGLYCISYGLTLDQFFEDFRMDHQRTAKTLVNFFVTEEMMEELDLDDFDYTHGAQPELTSRELRLLVNSMLEEMKEKFAVISIAHEAQKLMHESPPSASPDKLRLEQLMRYGTTLNNQFSKALGELKAVIKDRQT